MLLEPLRVEHARETAALFDDPALHEYVGGRPESEEELRRRYARVARGHSPDGGEGWLNWIVRERSGAVVGTVQATMRRDGSAELAWLVGSPYQGRGFAKEAAGAMAAWLCGRGVRVLVAHIHAGHAASMAVARALGLAPTDVVERGEVRWTGPAESAAAYSCRG